jgi:putative ATP-binding cassette transporter
LLGSFFYAGAASEAAGYGKRISELLESLWATNGVNDPENDKDDFGLEDDDSQAIAKIKRSDAARSVTVTSTTASTAGELSPLSLPNPPIVHLQDITITNPAGATLLRSLNLSLSANESCVIVGPSGCGKSSLLRVMARLWQPASDTGSIVLPSKVGEGGVFFLPQRPYMINASLRAEILYPSLSELSGAAQGVVDDRIKELFKTFDLSHLLQLYGLETVRNWDDVLSMGEQQRVAMVRLMLHKPSVVMLDECTSAVDEHQQQMFYKLLRDQGMCFISVGHRPELLRLHDKVQLSALFHLRFFSATFAVC